MVELFWASPARKQLPCVLLMWALVIQSVSSAAIETVSVSSAAIETGAYEPSS